jgi:ribosomal protein L40E
MLKERRRLYLEAKVMECTKCGTTNEEDAAFCKKCGSPLAAVKGAEAPAAAGDEATREKQPARTYLEAASFSLAIISSVAVMFSYFFPWVEASVSGAVSRYHELLWYWPLYIADTSFLAALVFTGFNLLPIILACSFAIMACLRMRSGDIGEGFFHTSLFMGVIFVFFLAGCIDFADYVNVPLERHWRGSVVPGHGSIVVTVKVGAAFLLLLPAAVGYLISTSLCGFGLLRDRVLKTRAAVLSFILSFVACFAGYILVWSVLSLML